MSGYFWYRGWQCVSSVEEVVVSGASLLDSL